MAERLFTVDEINVLIPRLERIVARLQQRGDELRRAVREALADGGGERAEIPVAELVQRRPEVEPVAREIEELLAEIEALGGEFKGLDLGLVDFPGEVDGRRVLLCWQIGERELGYFHDRDAGFGGRRPLPRSRPPLLQ